MERTTVGVKLEPGLRKRLKALGQARKRSTHWLMKEAITRYLEQEEAAERRHREAQEAWEHFQATGEYIAHEDMKAWLKSWGSEKELPPPARTRKWPR